MIARPTKLPQWLQTLLEGGVEHQESEERKRRARLFNGLVLIVGCMFWAHQEPHEKSQRAPLHQ